jgi:hypothetical protein
MFLKNILPQSLLSTIFEYDNTYRVINDSAEEIWKKAWLRWSRDQGFQISSELEFAIKGLTKTIWSHANQISARSQLYYDPKVIHIDDIYTFEVLYYDNSITINIFLGDEFVNPYNYLRPSEYVDYYRMNYQLEVFNKQEPLDIKRSFGLRHIYSDETRDLYLSNLDIIEPRYFHKDKLNYNGNNGHFI